MNRRPVAVIGYTVLGVAVVSFLVSIVNPAFSPPTWLTPAMLAVVGATYALSGRKNGNGDPPK